MSRQPSDELARLSSEGLLRSLRPLQSPAGPLVTRDDRILHNFAANDYLGLANDPRLAEAFIEGIRRYGSSSPPPASSPALLPPTQPSKKTSPPPRAPRRPLSSLPASPPPSAASPPSQAPATP